MNQSSIRLGCLCLALAAGVSASAQVAPTHFSSANPGAEGFPTTLSGSRVDYGQMVFSGDGQIAYAVTGIRQFALIIPDPKYPDGPGKRSPVTQRIPLFSDLDYWTSPRGIFPARSITQAQAVALGAKQADVDALYDVDWDPEMMTKPVISFEEASILIGDDGTEHLYGVDPGYRVQGTLNLVVDIPDTSSHLWRLGVTSSLGEEKYTGLVLPAGPQMLQVTNVEAGNCLVSLAAINGDNTMTTYHREVPVVVRKDTPGLVSMKFAGPSDSNRYRIYSLSVGQNSQDERGSVALASIRDANQHRDSMVRVMAYDAYGHGPSSSDALKLSIKVDVYAPSGQVAWSTTFDNQIGTHLTKTGRPTNLHGPILPGQWIQPGMHVSAKLINPANGQVLDTKDCYPTVTRPRTIIVHGYDVRPYRGDSGCPTARTPGEVEAGLLPYIREVFPYSDVRYQYDGKVWLMDYGQYPARGVSTTGAAMMVMNAMQGCHQTDLNADTEHLYLALINEKYAGSSTTGMAWYGYRGLACSRIPETVALGYNIGHEMGHCFGLEHAPSANANSYFLGEHVNRIDDHYQYGGNGLSGGWGYSAVGAYFLAEDAHTFANSLQAHWDPMSYFIGYRNYNSTRFNDLTTTRLMPHWGTTSAVPPASTVSMSALPSGIQVFDATSASQLQTWARGQTPLATPLMRQYKVSSSSDPLYGVDPSQGDPDDPTPPVLIVTQTPIIPGVTVSK